MKLSDVVSAMHLSIFATLPLLIFFGIFIGVAIHLLQGEQRFEQARNLPLEQSRREQDENQ
jgi:cbb3-type cytochrome oxidase subunit 3